VQQRTTEYAILYNDTEAPEKVQVVQAFAVKLANGTVCGMEPFLEGRYLKYSNNNGYVLPESPNTPQAFSHFTYEASHGHEIVVDVQGVNPTFTDPQIHARNRSLFSLGNQGEVGFVKFFDTHRCNEICRLLGLTMPSFGPPRVPTLPLELVATAQVPALVQGNHTVREANDGNQMMREALGTQTMRENHQTMSGNHTMGDPDVAMINSETIHQATNISMQQDSPREDNGETVRPTGETVRAVHLTRRAISYAGTTLIERAPLTTFYQEAATVRDVSLVVFSSPPTAVGPVIGTRPRSAHGRPQTAPSMGS